VPSGESRFIRPRNMTPPTQYAKCGRISIAYQVLGSGPIDLVYAHGWVSHLEYALENPDYTLEPFALDECAPSMANDEAARLWFGAYLRYAVSPGAARALSDLNVGVDVRSVLPTIGVPTLVLHRSGDRWFSVPEAQYLADHIPGAKFVVLPGDDHIPWWGDQEPLMGEIQEFLTGTRNSPPTERVLLTVLVTDIVGSTEKVAAMGDLRWKDRLHDHDAIVRREVKNFGGQEINTTGDGFVLAFAGPTRAIQCAKAISQRYRASALSRALGCIQANASGVGTTSAGLQCISRRASPATRRQTISSCPVRSETWLSARGSSS
jgi:hypothetical protein